jgi:DNA-binding transcriptional LysR family regulator
VTFLLFGPLMQSMNSLAPNLSLRFVALEPVVGDRVATGDIDFVVLPEEFEPGLPALPLFEDSWICLVWSGHPTVGDTLTVEQYLALPHLTYNLSSPQYASIADEHLARNGHERKIVASTETFATAPFLLRGTSLVTLVPRRLGERLREPADVRLVEPPFDLPPLREKLVWSPRFTASAAHTWLRSQLLEAAQRL